MATSSMSSMTKKQLVEELALLRRKLADYEAGETSAGDRRFRALVDNTLDGFFMLDLKGHIRDVNDGYIQMIGYTREELLSMRVQDLDPFAKPALFKASILKIVNAGEMRFETKHRRKDGVLIDLDCSVGYFAEGQGFLYCFASDITERKKIEAALRLAQFTLDSTSDAIIWVDPDATIVYANTAAYHASQAPAGAMIGRKLWEFNRSLDEARWRKRWNRVKRTGTERIEVEVTGLNGDITYLDAAITYITFGGRELYVSYARDITERKQMDEALYKANEKFSKIFHTSPIGIAITRLADGRYLDVNRAFVAMNGFERREDIIGKTSLQMNSWGSPEAREAFIKSLRPDPNREPAYIKLHTQSGQVRDALCAYDLIELDGEACLLATFQDVTQSRKVEEALRENEETLRTLINVLPVGVSLINPEVGIVKMNPALARITGLSEEELLQGTYRQRTYLSGDETVLPLDQLPTRRVLAEGRPIQDMEIGIVHEDGQITWSSVSAAPLPDRSVVAVTADITARKTAEAQLKIYQEHLEELVALRTAELREANEHLAALSRVKDEFVSNVSHELRTPIASLKLFTELLTIRPEKQHDYQSHLTRELKRLEEMVEDLLRLSRLDSQQVPLDMNEVDINQLVAQLVSDRRSLAESRGLALRATPAHEPLTTVADQGLIGQTLSILLTNAFNYTPVGGKVTVRARRRHGRDLNWVGFTVSDTGPGFLPEEKERLFTRFFRGRSARVSRTAGTGLGLAIAKEIIDRHAGRIEAESQGVPGRGARFSVWLPERK